MKKRTTPKQSLQRVLYDEIGASTIKEFSAKVGVPFSTMQYWLSGKCDPSFYSVIEVFKRLGYRIHLEKGDYNAGSIEL